MRCHCLPNVVFASQWALLLLKCTAARGGVLIFSKQRLIFSILCTASD